MFENHALLFRDGLANLPAGLLSAAQAEALHAASFDRDGDAARAREAAARAAGYLDAAAPYEEKVYLARVLQHLELYERSLPLYKELVVEPARVDSDVLQMLHAAMQLEDDRFLLDFCAAMRLRAVANHRLAMVEADVLWKYGARERAVEVLRTYLSTGPGEKDARKIRVRLSLMARELADAT